MPRYFFHIHTDGDIVRDDTGTEFGSLDDVRKAAQQLLPAVGYEEIPNDGDRRTLAVVVEDEEEQPIYSATLSYAGLWLTREQDRR